MTDQYNRFSSYPPLPNDQAHIDADPSSTLNSPISDFRRNEARPIITDDGKFLFVLLHVEFSYFHIELN